MPKSHKIYHTIPPTLLYPGTTIWLVNFLHLHNHTTMSKLVSLLLLLLALAPAAAKLRIQESSYSLDEAEAPEESVQRDLLYYDTKAPKAGGGKGKADSPGDAEQLIKDCKCEPQAYSQGADCLDNGGVVTVINTGPVPSLADSYSQCCDKKDFDLAALASSGITVTETQLDFSNITNVCPGTPDAECVVKGPCSGFLAGTKAPKSSTKAPIYRRRKLGEEHYSLFPEDMLDGAIHGRMLDSPGPGFYCIFCNL